MHRPMSDEFRSPWPKAAPVECNATSWPPNTPKARREQKNGRGEMRKVKSTTYTKTNFEQIATAIGTAVKPVEDLEAQFEAAAHVVSPR